MRLEGFGELLEFDEFDVEFENAPDGRLIDTERDRFGFRGAFGSGAVGGFFQVFGEKFDAPALLLTEFTNVGFGGGVIGAPRVGHSGQVDFLIPFKAEIDVAAGVEEVAGYDLEFVYAEVLLEAGFGVRFFGVQPAAGLMIHNLVGLFESDNPSSPSHLDPSVVSGTHVGGYVEVAYKHDDVPLTARIRAIGGEVSGVMFGMGVAF